MGITDPGHRELLPAANTEILRIGASRKQGGAPLRTLGAEHPLGGGEDREDLEDGWGWGRRGRETQA